MLLRVFVVFCCLLVLLVVCWCLLSFAIVGSCLLFVCVGFRRCSLLCVVVGVFFVFVAFLCFACCCLGLWLLLFV